MFRKNKSWHSETFLIRINNVSRGYVVHEVSSYFSLGLRQIRNAPRLIIPFLISQALFYAAFWTIIFTIALFSLPLMGKAVQVIEKNHDYFSEILRNESFAGNLTGPQMQMIEKEFSGMFPDMISFFIIFLLIFILTIIVYFLLFAWAEAGTTGYVWRGITGSPDFRNFRNCANHNFLRIAGLWALIIFSSIVMFTIPFLSLVLIPSPAGIIIFFLLMLLFFILWVIAIILLFFAEECIVIENKGIIDSVKRSRELVAGNVSSVLLYFFMLIIIFVFYFIVSGVFESVAIIFNSSFSMFFEIISLIILRPWVSLAQINFFLDITGRSGSTRESDSDIYRAVRQFIAGSPRILAGFIRNNIAYLLLSLSTFVTGAATGYYIGRSLSFMSEDFIWLISEGTAKTRLLGPYTSIPFIDFLDYFSNNSQVALSRGLSGLFFVVPSVLGAAVDGIIVGLVYGIFPAAKATAFLAAHGIIEMAAFVIVAAAGMKLGVEFIKGKRDENELIDDALKVALASLLLIAVAAFIEAFITPVLISEVI